MKWLITFLAGLVIGAGGLFVYLRQIAHEPAVGAVVVAPVATVPGTAPGTVAGTATADQMGALGKAPVVTTDLTEADLPLRPAAQEFPALKSVDAATTSSTSSTSSTTADASTAPAAKLMIPVDGIKLAQLSDNFDQPRGKERHHEALDIMAPKGTKVIAVADGKVTKLFNSKPGGLTVYQFDPTEKYAYYYAHLDRYAEGVKEGMQLSRGDLVGYVGTTGNADPAAPHLHFAVVELTPEKQWWKGTPVNPFPLMGE